MNHKAIKVGLTATVLVAAFGALMYMSLSENLQAYKYVDEVMADPQQWVGKSLKVHGYVVPNSIRRKEFAREYLFDVQRNGKVVTAHFLGSPPDAFKDDAEVVLTGVLNSKEGRFTATKMEAKCPSKYEEGSKKPAAIARADGVAED